MHTLYHTFAAKQPTLSHQQHHTCNRAPIAYHHVSSAHSGIAVPTFGWSAPKSRLSNHSPDTRVSFWSTAKTHEEGVLSSMQTLLCNSKTKSTRKKVAWTPSFSTLSPSKANTSLLFLSAAEKSSRKRWFWLNLGTIWGRLCLEQNGKRK